MISPKAAAFCLVFAFRSAFPENKYIFVKKMWEFPYGTFRLCGSKWRNSQKLSFHGVFHMMRFRNSRRSSKWRNSQKLTFYVVFHMMTIFHVIFFHRIWKSQSNTLENTFLELNDETERISVHIHQIEQQIEIFVRNIFEKFNSIAYSMHLETRESWFLDDMLKSNRA